MYPFIIVEYSFTSFGKIDSRKLAQVAVTMGWMWFLSLPWCRLDKVGSAWPLRIVIASTNLKKSRN